MLPVTLIGGYLGSGKTTLVNHLLRHANGMKLAVLVNEFGELPIDADLIEAQEDDLISIAGGCICCSYGDDMLEGIQRLRDMYIQPDHLIIEASGVAMPQSIAAAMSLVRDVSLHSIVIIADAETLHERSRDRYMGDTVTRQLECADLLILNRCDLASQHDKQLAYEVFAKHASSTTIIESNFANVPVGVLLDKEYCDTSQDRTFPTDTAHAKFKSTFVPCSEPLDANALGKRLQSEVPGIIRAKGFVIDKSSGGICLLQLSGKRIRITRIDLEASGTVSDRARQNTQDSQVLGVVVIGIAPLFDGSISTTMLHEPLVENVLSDSDDVCRS